MKRLLTSLLAVVIVLTMAGAPAQVRADSTIAVSSSNGGMTAVPVRSRGSVLPYLGISTALSQNELARAFYRMVSSRVAFNAVSGEYRTEFDSGNSITWDLGRCSFKNYTGTATLTYYIPTWWNPLFADDTPYYTFEFWLDENQPDRMYQGTIYCTYLDYFQLNTAFALWRAGFEGGGSIYNYEGANGEFVQAVLGPNVEDVGAAFSYTFAFPTNR